LQPPIRTGRIRPGSRRFGADAQDLGSSGAAARFVGDFVSAWVKVMKADRFDLRR
jgi:catalase (peroxidase I)